MFWAVGIIYLVASGGANAVELRQPRAIQHEPFAPTSTPRASTSNDHGVRDAFQLRDTVSDDAAGPAELESEVTEKADPLTSPTTEATAKPQTKLLTPLGKRVRSVLDEYYVNPLNTRDDDAWDVLHWSIAYGVDANVSVGHPRGDQVAAIGWLCCNYPSAGKQIIELHNGRWDLSIAPGRQGHDAQFLAMLAQSRVARDYMIRVAHQEHTVEDLIEFEKRTCRSGQESTFKLISLAYYEGTDAKWKNYRGELWSVDRLLAEELKAPIGRYTSTCGGIHRLYAIDQAVKYRRRDGLPMTALYRQAEQKTKQYQRRAFSLQNGDGSFSTAWLDEAEQQGDATRRLTTSGHILEWLAASLDEDQLDDPRFERAVAYVAQLLERRSHYDWYPGALGHALHALSIYEQRTAGTEAGERSTRIAQQAPSRGY